MLNSEIIAERIVTRRTALGLNQTDLERVSGVTRQQIANLESGRSKEAKTGTLIKLSDALDCTVDYLLGKSVNPN